VLIEGTDEDGWEVLYLRRVDTVEDITVFGQKVLEAASRTQC
jgi:hypothetical protein